MWAVIVHVWKLRFAKQKGQIYGGFSGGRAPSQRTKTSVEAFTGIPGASSDSRSLASWWTGMRHLHLKPPLLKWVGLGGATGSLERRCKQPNTSSSGVVFTTLNERRRLKIASGSISLPSGFSPAHRAAFSYHQNSTKPLARM